jgi:hypothetical protein
MYRAVGETVHRVHRSRHRSRGLVRVAVNATGTSSLGQRCAIVFPCLLIAPSLCLPPLLSSLGNMDSLLYAVFISVERRCEQGRTKLKRPTIIVIVFFLHRSLLRLTLH